MFGLGFLLFADFKSPLCCTSGLS